MPTRAKRSAKYGSATSRVPANPCAITTAGARSAPAGMKSQPAHSASSQAKRRSVRVTPSASESGSPGGAAGAGGAASRQPESAKARATEKSVCFVAQRIPRTGWL
ncbi:MAG: hypothetical protein FJ108_05330 [Deltaproteobacteria bacterium]|nr:hypothetical protein [Deltaproteobacteria bacterium]